MVIEKIKAVHPEVPVIIYINKSGALLERMATSGVDIVSLDWTVTVPEARKRIGATHLAITIDSLLTAYKYPLPDGSCRCFW